MIHFWHYWGHIEEIHEFDVKSDEFLLKIMDFVPQYYDFSCVNTWSISPQAVVVPCWCDLYWVFIDFNWFSLIFHPKTQGIIGRLACGDGGKVVKTMNFVLKTMNFVLKTMNLQDTGGFRCKTHALQQRGGGSCWTGRWQCWCWWVWLWYSDLSIARHVYQS